MRAIKDITRPARRWLAGAIFPSGASYSGCGEDILAWKIISRAEPDPARITYLDIGAGDPIELSNTFLFYRRGASGVLVEPDPRVLSRLRRTRPRDTIIGAAATFDARTHAPLSRLSNPVFNSLDSDFARRTIEHSKTWSGEAQEMIDSITVPLVRINDILREHFSSRRLHLLSIDAEGMDFGLLKSVDLHAFRPLVICIECQASPAEHMDVLGPHGYSLVQVGEDNFVFKLDRMTLSSVEFKIAARTECCSLALDHKVDNRSGLHDRMCGITPH
jgi:FkbM family methyltransferase